MEVIVNNKKVVLQKQNRKIGDEAPAIRITMNSGETKVIGMMADKVQVFITAPYSNSISEDLTTIINKHKTKSLIYIICPEKLTNIFEDIDTSVDFKQISMKIGVNIEDELCAKSIFIINKDGEFVYKQILPTLDEEFHIEKFDKALSEAINFKKKGHTHENWMGA